MPRDICVKFCNFILSLSQITLADLTAVNMGLAGVIFGGKKPEEHFKKWPKLAALKGRVEANPALAKWVKERPESPF